MDKDNRNHSANPDVNECAQERLSMSESIASVALAVLGIFTMLRGFAWIMYYDNPADSELYASLITAAPLYVWGTFFVVGGAFLALSSWYLPRRTVRKRFAYSLVVGGGVASPSYFIVAVAGFNNATTWLMPSQMIMMALFGLILVFFGGMQLWQMRTTTKGS